MQDLELLRKKRKDNKVLLLGISCGVLLAMNYAANFPQHVSNLVLLGSAPPSYKLWNVLSDNQYVRRSQEELDSIQLLYKIFSHKTDAELDSLKSIDPHSKEVMAFKKFMAIHVRAMHYERNMSTKSFESLFAGFNFQAIPLIDQEGMETKWDICSGLKKISVPRFDLIWPAG